MGEAGGIGGGPRQGAGSGFAPVANAETRELAIPGLDPGLRQGRHQIGR